jgi:tRNA (guanine-N7-)-methyltransferase
MAAPPGRPTPQIESRAEGERPRFKDRSPEEIADREANPFFDSHRTFGPELLPAADAWPWRGRWAEYFGREAPLHVEIGSGNGFFLAELAQRNPDWNILGIEIRYKRTVLCAKKLRVGGGSNARIVRYHAAYLDDLFEPGSLSGLYVNHPDPWPKERHEKNRLISRWFMEDVVSLLKPGALFRLKSDHLPNIERAIDLIDKGPEGEPAPRLPLRVNGRADDVTKGPAPWPDDIETNYQRKFRLKGLPVYALEIARQADE